MDRAIIEFGKRMDTAEDKKTLVEYAAGFKIVLDLGAGTGKIARDIATAYKAHVDAVDIQFKDNCQNSDNVTYYGMDILEFVRTTKTKYDCIVMSALLHELDECFLEELFTYLPNIMDTNCRIIIREPFYDDILGPINAEDSGKFVNLVKDNSPAGKAIEFFTTRKLHSSYYGMLGRCLSNRSALEWLNLCFTLSYGEQSWEREKYELRYARPLNWVKSSFDFEKRPFTSFQVLPVLDTTYRRHFINANIPAAAFDLIKYTGMLVIIDYSK